MQPRFSTVYKLLVVRALSLSLSLSFSFLPSGEAFLQGGRERERERERRGLTRVTWYSIDSYQGFEIRPTRYSHFVTFTFEFCTDRFVYRVPTCKFIRENVRDIGG